LSAKPITVTLGSLMPKQALGRAQIGELSRALRDVFDFHKALRGKYPSAAMIQFPKTPSDFSEAIVLELIKNGKILEVLKGYECKLGGKKADILARSGDFEVRIEVKATGKSAFQFFGPKDVVADYLIWVHFGDFFSDAKEAIKIYVVQEPERFFKAPQKITLSAFRKIANPVEHIFDLECFLR
jgi:hypothetical protein